MTTVEKVYEIIMDMLVDDVISLWNEYCRENRYDEDVIYAFDEESINEAFQNFTPFEILNRGYFGKYIPNADYFQFNGEDIACIYSTEIKEYIDMMAIAEMICDDLDKYIREYEELAEFKEELA